MHFPVSSLILAAAIGSGCQSSDTAGSSQASNLTPGMYIWIAPPANSAVQGIFVDQILFEKPAAK